MWDVIGSAYRHAGAIHTTESHCESLDQPGISIFHFLQWVDDFGFHWLLFHHFVLNKLIIIKIVSKKNFNLNNKFNKIWCVIKVFPFFLHYLSKLSRELKHECVMLNIKPGASPQSTDSREQVAAGKIWEISCWILGYILFFRTNTTNVSPHLCAYDYVWCYLGNIKCHRLQEYK